MAEELQPVGLLPGEEFEGGEILQIFVIGHDIDRGGGALKIVPPMLKHLEDSEQLLIMGIIVEL